MPPPEPTEQERRRAELRANMARTEQQRLGIARTICGKAKRLAHIARIYRLNILPERVYYCADYGDGKGWTPKCPQDDERQPGSKLFRWTHTFHFIAAAGRPYRPNSPNVFACYRASRFTVSTLTIEAIKNSRSRLRGPGLIHPGALGRLITPVTREG